jgi:hypothetical protein
MGDNPFHGVSHLSQERARIRSTATTEPRYASQLAQLSFQNGAEGFMFTVDETTLSILRAIRDDSKVSGVRLYALTPYAYQYARLATRAGTVRLASGVAKQVLLSGNRHALLATLRGLAMTDVSALLAGFLSYEISRIRSSIGECGKLESLLLHEVVTDFCLSLGLESLFTSFIDFVSTSGITPGFETRNFAFLTRKLLEWGVDFGKIVIAAPFNKVGFQMTPSREDCEEALTSLPAANVLAMSPLAAGYLEIREALVYIKSIKDRLTGLVIGVSTESQCTESFELAKELLSD